MATIGTDTTVWYRWANTATIGTDTTVWYRWANTASTGDTNSAWKRWTAGSWSTSSAASSDTWEKWCDYASIDTASTADTTWYRWCNYEYTPVPDNRRAVVAPPPRVISEPCRVQAIVNREAADKKAELLLSQFLSPEQLRDFQKHKRFRVGVGDKLYEIDCTKRMHNVFEVVDGKLVNEHCIYSSLRGGNLPLADNALAQKMMLETDEAKFRRIANLTRFALPQHSPLALAQ